MDSLHRRIIRYNHIAQVLTIIHVIMAGAVLVGGAYISFGEFAMGAISLCIGVFIFAFFTSSGADHYFGHLSDHARFVGFLIGILPIVFCITVLWYLIFASDLIPEVIYKLENEVIPVFFRRMLIYTVIIEVILFILIVWDTKSD